MLANSILALGAFAISSVYAQSSNICEASPYRGLGCLASNTAAASECSSRVPAVISTVTSTTSVLAEVTQASSAKTKVESASQVTISSTNVKETWTTTVTLYVSFSNPANDNTDKTVDPQSRPHTPLLSLQHA